MQVASTEAPVDLSPALRKTTAVLDAPNPGAPGGSTRVYILAMSHVSSVSCDQVRELIRAVQPDAVMVELCKDRLGLLATDFPAGPRVWHTPAVKITGLLEGSGFPTADELATLCTCKPGRPISQADIEGDVKALQATGLFRSVRPNARPGTVQDAPLFVTSEEEGGSLRVDTVPPFASLEFRCETRGLPEVSSLEVRVSSKAAAAGVDVPAGRLQSIRDATMAAMRKEGARTVAVLMGMRARVRAEVGAAAAVDVVFDGVDTGEVEAVVVLQEATGALRTGLEGSAEEGAGAGIEVFDTASKTASVRVGLTSSVPPEAIEAIAQKAAVARSGGADASPVAADDPAAAASTPLGRLSSLEGAAARGRGTTQWRPWTWRELATAADEDPEPQPLKDLLAEKLTRWYGGFQGQAGETVGVRAGDAWRVRPSPPLHALRCSWAVGLSRSAACCLQAQAACGCVQIALEEGVRCGAAQIVLGDRPAFVTQRRLAQGVWGALFPRALGGLLAFNAAVFCGSFGVADPGLASNAAAATLVATLASFAPVALPFFEIWKFSRMGEKEIEDAVAVPESIQGDLGERMKLYGEDALLDWPGASESIIEERDEYMTRALVASASGAALCCVRAAHSSRTLAAHAALPGGGPERACPKPGAGNPPMHVAGSDRGAGG